MAKIKEEIELKIAELQMDYYTEKNNFANVNDYVKSELQKGVELSNGAEISCDENGTLTYEGLEIGTFNPDGSVTIDGELSGNQIVQKYTVSYDANGGIGDVPASKKYAAGESVSVDFTTKPTKKGANFLGWARTENATAPEYITPESFTMGAQNVTLYAVWENFAAATISVTNYGDKVNYSANGVSDWQVFLNDGSNVYLISSDYVPNSGVTDKLSKTGSYAVYGSSGDELVSTLVNTEDWSEYAKGFNGAIAMGGPTLEQFWASYNGKYGTNYSAESQELSSHTGYSNILYFPHTSSWNSIDVYWLASSYSSNANNVEGVAYDGSVRNRWYGHTIVGVRPLVKLPASAKMSWNGAAWDLSN